MTTQPEREPLTMARCQRLEEAGFWYLAEVGRKYAIDRPRWWHRFLTRRPPGRTP